MILHSDLYTLSNNKTGKTDVKHVMVCTAQYVSSVLSPKGAMVLRVLIQ